MVFITEERERTSTLDCRRVRRTFHVSRQEWRKQEGSEAKGCVAIAVAEWVWPLCPSSCPRSRSSAATPTCLSPMKRPCCWPMQTQGPCLPSLVCKTLKYGSFRTPWHPATQSRLERGVLNSLWPAPPSPSCPAWLSFPAVLPVLPEIIFHQHSRPLNQGKEAKVPFGNTATVPVCRSVFGSGGGVGGGGDPQIQEGQ